ncbi:hypothetical protein [Rhodonellum sp.]|uniref:hypothetical protein n=1 Tax=Rhodonellum sp. TaxID=2231180 RepID=UPI0027253B86|nr:hypothetical protein [Rhodonellum sp.]MDO9551126.1 hypothetical protein [Rhodonellum sp.]
MFFEGLIGIASGIFTFWGLFAVGQLALALKGVQYKGIHGKVVVGFGLFHLFFLGISMFLPTGFIWYTCVALFLLAIFFQLKDIKKSDSNFSWLFPLLISVIFLPYLFRLFSPPIFTDGLFYYLPSIAWVFTNGLAFNPYLTQYTTMPQGVEYLFTIPFGFAGYAGVRSLDALGTVALIHLIYQSGKDLFGKRKSEIFVLSALLIKGTFFLVFATGKIDTWNTYVVMTGILFFCQSHRKDHLIGAFVIFSIALGLKYTNYLLLFLPLIYLWIQILRTLGGKPAFITSIIPLMFIAPVLIRNHWLVNNPFAPLIQLDGQSRYVASHGTAVVSNAQFQISGELSGKELMWELLQEGLRYRSTLIFLLFLLVAWLLWKKRVFLARELKLACMLWLLMGIPWMLVLGNTAQPLRFVWAPLLLTVLIFILGLNQWILYKKYDTGILEKISKLTLLLVVGTAIYAKHYHYFPDYFTQKNRTLPEWYTLIGSDHYSISYQFKALGLHHARVNYRVPVVLGAFEINDYGNIPTQEEFIESKDSMIEGFDYCLDRGMEKLAEIPLEDIVLQSGEFFVYRIK